jgi:hypothetical protein
MKRDRFAQRPNIDSGSAKDKTSQPAFIAYGVKAGSDEAVLPVVNVTANGVQLGGGAAAGMTVGSTYRAGDATLRITKVDATSALANAIGGAIKPGDRARLTTYVAPSTVLRVSVAGLAAATRAALAGQLRSNPGIVLVEGARDFAHLIVRPRENNYVILGLDGAARHTAGDIAQVATLLAQEAGAHQLASLENPAHSFGFDFTFSNNVKAFKVGDAVAFRARSARDGYLTIVDLGTDGRVVVIFPSQAGQDNHVTADQDVVLPTGDVQFEAQLPSGRGIVRAFVTEKPLDLPFHEGAATQAALVGKALHKAIGATGSGIPVNNWATAAIVYSITK